MAHVLDEKKQLLANAEKFKDQLSKIKVLAFDIDGILTNGAMTYLNDEIGFNRTYHILDGYGMKMMKDLGFKVGVISGADGVPVRKRFQDILKCDFVFLGNEDKREAYKNVLKMGFKDEEILYMGDEFIDVAILKRVGFAATVPNSSVEIQEAAHYVTKREGGNGAAREVMDMVRYAQNLKAPVLEF
ncbi:MAG: HAD hydrolase family protein [Bacteriovoracaceae bacterium]|jgi:3-deoxy-D-manno-octulosonate 8-phosphate phosphatase (KDO 8-P phosphatase)|nr:HAD hydrolase family protein [Bacteriovoracaceae bacterium]